MICLYTILASGPAAYSPHPIWILPFVAVLLFIALAPLIHLHWWEKRYPFVAGALFLVGLGYYLLVRTDLAPWLHEMREYFSFIVLLLALFVISGGIHIHLSRRATASANTTLLLIGSILANIFGTTGAAMLLIRPYLRINRGHLKPYHVIFFIFTISNVGGCLTPIGDPPLFLGYLKGVPFWWVFEHCWQPWMLALGILLAVFFIIDWRDHRKAERRDWSEDDPGPAVRINGVINVLFIIVVIVAVFRPSVFEAVDHLRTQGVTAGGLIAALFSREVLMLAATGASLAATKRAIYKLNEFGFAPIIEVALLFIAIFSTMVPALEWLDANADRLPLDTPGHFYFATGGLSSVLDNAPTYLTFLQTRLGEIDQTQVEQAQRVLNRIHEAYMADPGQGLVLPADVQDAHVRQAVRAAIQYHAPSVKAGNITADQIKVYFLIGVPGSGIYLVAISVGAVFFGALTYIGNAPNFMVKSIAESSGMAMPSFFGYMFRYSLPILIPTYVLVWAVFFLNWSF